MLASPRLIFGMLLTLTAAGPAPTADDWTNKTVILKGIKAVKIALPDESGTMVDRAILTSFYYRVIDDSNGWLKVNQNGIVGWFNKDDAVVLEDAPNYFSGRIQKNGKDFGAYASRGVAWQLLNDLDNAIKDYSEAIRLQPKTAELWNVRAIAWAAVNDYDNAIKDYDEAVRLNPKNASFFNNRGVAFRSKKEHDKAIRDFDEAIRLSPKFSKAFANRGDVWCDLAQYAKASSDYTEAIRIDPKYALAYAKRARVMDVTGDFGQVVKDFEKALQIQEMASVYRDYALFQSTCPDANFRNGKIAVEMAIKACKMAPEGWKKGTYLTALAAAYAEAGNFNDAVHYQQQALTDQTLHATTRAKYEERLKLYQQEKPLRSG